MATCVLNDQATNNKGEYIMNFNIKSAVVTSAIKAKDATLFVTDYTELAVGKTVKVTVEGVKHTHTSVQAHRIAKGDRLAKRQAARAVRKAEKAAKAEAAKVEVVETNTEGPEAATA